jgi:hypothetical protein
LPRLARLQLPPPPSDDRASAPERRFSSWAVVYTSDFRDLDRLRSYFRDVPGARVTAVATKPSVSSDLRVEHLPIDKLDAVAAAFAKHRRGR